MSDNSTSPIVEFKDVSFRLQDGRSIVSDLNLTIRPSEIVVFLGRSGSGKTTTLKLINGLLTPSSGAVLVQGRSTRDWDRTALRRRIGYVIQEIGLFPHFDVSRNVGLVPNLEGWNADQIQERVHELLRLMDLAPGDFAARLPAQLSGGQRQRVGVARALAADPPLLLLDEPFGALDPLTRLDLQRELLRLQSQLAKTMVFVTHDVREGLLLASRIALFCEGRIVFVGTPDDFLAAEHPEAQAFAEALEPPIREDRSHPPGGVS